MDLNFTMLLQIYGNGFKQKILKFVARYLFFKHMFIKILLGNTNIRCLFLNSIIAQYNGCVSLLVSVYIETRVHEVMESLFP